ncbi:MAG: 1,4-dihydroxy-6-naphthoate synthase [Chitinophagaceae bacterium]
MKLSIGFSPCPNDTFIFDALINKKIDTRDLEFEAVLEDVQTLNEWAAEGRLDVTKLSLPALFDNTDKYTILNSGAALGQGCGPLLISKNEIDTKAIDQYKIAIPGVNTTANFLLSFGFPNATNKQPMLFSQIENAVLSNEVQLGVIIHESRFTYAEKGLKKVCDLGEVWEEKQHLPIPLGCIAAKKELPKEVISKVDELIRASLTYSFNHYPQISDYTKQHAQEMNQDVMRQHIELYVNNYSMDLGEPGKAAIQQLYETYAVQQNNRVPLSQLFT